MTIAELAPIPLPAGIRSRQVDNGNGLSMHLLEAGFDAPGRPCVLLLHGFPELAYSWRKVMLPLAEAGFHVVAPDQRGYGRTTGSQQGYEAGLDEFRLLNLVRDAAGLVSALGHQTAAVVGHDFGSPVAAWCALSADGNVYFVASLPQASHLMRPWARSAAMRWVRCVGAGAARFSSRRALSRSSTARS